QDTMAPLASKYEPVYSCALLRLPSEDDLYLECNMDAYLRADATANAEALTKLIQYGLRTHNKARKLNNYEPEEGGDDFFMQSVTIPIKMIQQMLLSKTPQQRKTIARSIEKQLEEGISPQLIIEGLLNTNGNGKH